MLFFFGLVNVTYGEGTLILFNLELPVDPAFSSFFPKLYRPLDTSRAQPGNFPIILLIYVWCFVYEYLLNCLLNNFLLD
jgi:hypothetical protein